MSPARLATWFLRAHAVAAVLLLGGLGHLYGPAMISDPTRLAMAGGLGGLAVLLWWLGRSADPRGAALCLLLLDGGLAAANALLESDAFTNPWAAEASRRGLPFDRRIPAEVVLDDRAAGRPDTALFVPPTSFYRAPLMVDGVPTLPLAGIASRPTVHCNESGSVSRHDSDAFGFNNPSWPERARIAVVGDSFANGACVPPADGMVAPLRRLGSTANLARDGFSALAELAVLREFRLLLRPELVVWVYFEGNDLDDLPDEAASPILARYLNDSTETQNLAGRRAGINAALERHLEEYLADLRKRRATPFFGLRNFARNRLPALIAAWKARPPSAEEEGARLALFTRVMDQALAEQRAADEKMLFVLLPAPDSMPEATPLRAERRRQVLAAMAARKVEVLDTANVLAGWPKERIFVFGLWSHFTAEAHRAVGEAITARAETMLR